MQACTPKNHELLNNRINSWYIVLKKKAADKNTFLNHLWRFQGKVSTSGIYRSAVQRDHSGPVPPVQLHPHSEVERISEQECCCGVKFLLQPHLSSTRQTESESLSISLSIYLSLYLSIYIRGEIKYILNMVCGLLLRDSSSFFHYFIMQTEYRKKHWNRQMWHKPLHE